MEAYAPSYALWKMHNAWKSAHSTAQYNVPLEKA